MLKPTQKNLKVTNHNLLEKIDTAISRLVTRASTLEK